jgi:hypothetical protein
MNTKLAISELNQLLVQSGVENVVQYLCGTGNFTRRQDYLSSGNYVGTQKGDSFYIYTTGRSAGFWKESNLSESPNGKESGDLLEYWCVVKDIGKADACNQIREYLRLEQPHEAKKAKTMLKLVNADKPQQTIKVKLAEHISGQKPASLSTMRLQQTKLYANTAALNYLYGRGLTDETISHFHLGLSQSNKHTDYVNALTFPVIREDGIACNPYPKVNIPNITQNPVSENGWCTGAPRFTFNTKRLPSHEWLIITEGQKDLWILHQLLRPSNLYSRILLASSTHGSAIPYEVVNDPRTLAGFKKILLAHDADPAGDDIARSYKPYIDNRGYRLRPPFIFMQKGDDKDWTDFANQSGTVKQLLELITKAEALRQDDLHAISNINDLKEGESYAYNPVDISGAFANGYLYCPVTTIDSAKNAFGVLAASRVTKVVRSDKQVFDYHEIPGINHPGAHSKPLYALGDGTIIADIPKISPYQSWKWGDIDRWKRGGYHARKIDEIIEDIMRMMKSQIWLPNESDYLILALVAVVTYVQTVFEAVPLVLATGPAGSGKSALGEFMANVSANGVVIGDASAATITRLMDVNRGLLVLDDIEKIHSKSSKSSQPQVDDLLQILKTSYKQRTAMRSITDVKSGEVNVLNFYGVKFMNNTQGIDEILGTRTITIHTRRAPAGVFKHIDSDPEDTMDLRQELHAWSMDFCKPLHQAYKQHSKKSRPEEITAPLRAIVDIANKAQWHDALDDLVARINIEQESTNSPESVVRESCVRLAKRGFASVAVEQVIMEMSTLVPDNYMKEYTTDIPEWRQVNWVRKHLVNLGFINASTSTRDRPFGRINAMRFYKLQSTVYHEAESANDTDPSLLRTIDGNQFCKMHISCKDCPYETVLCEIREKTTKKRY